MQIAKVQNEEHKVVLVHISCNSSILRKPRKCLFTYFSVYLQNKAGISRDNYWLITIGNYIQSHFLQFFKLRWVTCLPVPTIFMAFKMHPVYNNFCGCQLLGYGTQGLSAYILCKLS